MSTSRTASPLAAALDGQRILALNCRTEIPAAVIPGHGIFSPQRRRQSHAMPRWVCSTSARCTSDSYVAAARLRRRSRGVAQNWDWIGFQRQNVTRAAQCTATAGRLYDADQGRHHRQIAGVNETAAWASGSSITARNRRPPEPAASRYTSSSAWRSIAAPTCESVVALRALAQVRSVIQRHSRRPKRPRHLALEYSQPRAVALAPGSRWWRTQSLLRRSALADKQAPLSADADHRAAPAIAPTSHIAGCRT